jgi:hypothetical protein
MLITAFPKFEGTPRPALPGRALHWVNPSTNFDPLCRSPIASYARPPEQRQW